MSLAANLQNLGALMKTNLETKGVENLTRNMGLTTLANKILEIEGSSQPQQTITITTDNLDSGDIFTQTFNFVYTGTVTINWGDGNIDTYDGSSGEDTAISHEYSSGGRYTIRIIGDITGINALYTFPNSAICSAIIPEGVTSLGDECFKRAGDLQYVTLPSSLTSIGDSCFESCSKLEAITIPENVTSMGEACFKAAVYLANVNILGKITSLPDYCFKECSTLVRVVLPNSITNIGSQCFYGLGRATSDVTCDIIFSGSVPSVDGSFFEQSPDCYFNIYVPKGSISAYQTALGTPNFATYVGYIPNAKLKIMGATRKIGVSGDMFYVFASLTDENGVVISGETLSVKAMHGNTILDSDTVTSGNGQVYYEYEGSGAGEVKIIFSYGSFLQETFVIYDSILYDLMTSDTTSDYYYNNTGGTSLAFSNGSFILTGGTNNRYFQLGSNTGVMSNLARFKGKKLTLEVDVKSITGKARVSVYEYGGGAFIQQKDSEYSNEDVLTVTTDNAISDSITRLYLRVQVQNTDDTVTMNNFRVLGA